MRCFVTGNSSGLGLALTQEWLALGADVYGLSRRGCSEKHERLADRICDLSDLDAIPQHVGGLLAGVSKLDVVMLNAGVLGKISSMPELSMDDINFAMATNVWANKVILDCLLNAGIEVDQIVLISSGAAVNGNRGWGGYSLSKATLNMLAQLYSHEFVEAHVVSLAPGLVDTAMQAYISDPEKIDVKEFPSFARLREAKGTDWMPTANQVAQDIIEMLPSLKQFQSGSFVDIRDL